MKRPDTYIKAELIFVIKWNITLLWMILAFKMYFMLIFQWTVIVLLFFLLFLEAWKWSSQSYCESSWYAEDLCQTHKTLLGVRYIEIFIYLFNSEYNMPVLGFTSRPTKCPDMAIMGKKGSWKPHVLHLGAKWEFDLTDDAL